MDNKPLVDLDEEQKRSAVQLLMGNWFADFTLRALYDREINQGIPIDEASAAIITGGSITMLMEWATEHPAIVKRLVYATQDESLADIKEKGEIAIREDSILKALNTILSSVGK